MEECIVIAEAGVNHNGDLVLAKELVHAAAEAKADYVKFQSFKADKLVSKKATKAIYQINNTGNGAESQYMMLKKLELSHKSHLELIEECKKYKINFLSTAFDHEGIDDLIKMGVQMLKSPSGELTNRLYLEALGKSKLPIILSSGMATLEEIQNAVDILISEGKDLSEITILHCNTQYPTPLKDVNLKAMVEIKQQIGCKVGYSDHTLGITVPVASVALGASVIEKHFTLSRKMEGPDHSASLEPNELTDMVKAIRETSICLGSSIKKPSSSELENINIARKSIHTKNAIKKGRIIKKEDLIPLRPGDGISPMEIYNLIGRKAKRDLNANHKLQHEDIIFDE